MVPYFIFCNIPYSISIRTIIQERSVTIPRSEKPYVTTGKYSSENRNGLYDGNYKEFLEEYNGKENLTGLYRLMDPVYTDSKSITGVKLDFIW